MKAHASLGAQQTRLIEWAEMIRTVKNVRRE